MELFDRHAIIAIASHFQNLSQHHQTWLCIRGIRNYLEWFDIDFFGHNTLYSKRQEGNPQIHGSNHFKHTDNFSLFSNRHRYIMKHILKYLKRLMMAFLLCLGFIVISNHLVRRAAKSKTYASTSKIPKQKVGLLLGTVKILPNGRLNLYYKYRIDAAVALYEAKKIEYILVSGDNGKTNYDEPSTFKDDLIKKGIPENRIYLDYAGFRTLDSVIRAKAIFGLSSFIVISQKFHNDRAIYLAKRHDIQAIGFNAKDVTGRYGFKTRMREYLAKTKAVVDILLNVKPKFLGKKIEIG